MKFPGITFDSQLTFKKHFEDILDRCNTRYHRLGLLANKIWGPTPATIIQIYKLNNASDTNFLNTVFFRQLSPRTISSAKFSGSKASLSGLPCVYQNTSVSKLLHDSTGLPCVKDRLLFCTAKSLDRIAQNPQVEESISSNRFNPAWERSQRHYQWSVL